MKSIHYFINSFLKVTLIICVLSLLFSACKKKDKDLTPTVNNIYQDAFAFRGENPIITDVKIIEDGTEYIVRAFSGHVIVYFEKEISLERAKQIISNLGGEIIEQIPSIQYYLVKVPDGKESDFISNIYSNSARYAFPNTVLSISQYVIIDNYSAGSNHGVNVESIINGCRQESSDINRFNVGYVDSDGSNYIDFDETINDITSLMVGKSLTDGTPVPAKSPILINLSMGPSIIKNNQELCYDDNRVTPEERISYIRNWQDAIYRIIARIDVLNKINKEFQKDFVITLAAGNERLPDFYKQIIEPMFIPNHKGIVLTQDEQKILKNNIVIVTAIDSKDPSYTNNSSNADPVVAVDISGLPYTGTSFAAPQALCYIGEIMDLEKENGTKLTAVEALAAVKEAVKKNPQGEFVFDEALATAKGEYLAGTGDIKITLTWNNKVDLDLHVIDPNGEEISFENEQSASGGKLDMDNTDGYGPENIFWENGKAIKGTYRVYVHFYDHGESSSNSSSYIVKVKYLGLTQTFNGTVNYDQTVPVCSFADGKFFKSANESFVVKTQSKKAVR
jgi:membrane-bound inhibitor of C-type lysozyme